MSLDRTVAHFVTHRRGLIGFAVALLVVASVLAIVLRGRLASDILDLLPQHFDSVQTFKIYDREFSQGRQLTFAIIDESGECDLDAFTAFFGEKLALEPGIVRVMDHSLADSAEGARDVQSIAAPLLLNLEPAEFAAAISALEPPAIEARLKHLRAALEAGSPKAEMELELDPLGLVIPALKPLAGSFSLEKSQPLASPDGTLRLVLAITDQTDLGAHACQATMRRIEDFNARILANWSAEHAGEKLPQILVTGRTAYVAELSLKMRSDVISTLLSSIVLVSLTFYIGFRRVRPLLAIMHVLLLCCVAAIAAGVLVFHELNMITIGLCSILIGLGVDFGMLLFGVYQVEREAGLDHESAVASALRQQGRGIIFGALTSAAAFLCLLLSECAGFMQLGVLIAFGIVFAAGFMMTVFFVFIPQKHRPQTGDWLRTGSHRFVSAVLAVPRAFFCATAVLLVALAVFSATPKGRIQFEANPKSLEPRNSRAGEAMRAIMAKMPALGEPLIALVQTPDTETFHDHWTRLHAAWTKLVATGQIKSVATPAAFTLSPARARANAAHISLPGLSAAREALTRTLAAEGLSVDSFGSAFALLDSLAKVSGGNFDLLDWHQSLPANSSWWFILDRFLGNSPNVGMAYITPVKPLVSFAEKEALRHALAVPGIETHVSGWTYTLADLLPWSQGKLVELSSVMLGLNIVLLIFLYRRWFPLFILMLSLALSVGAMLATLRIFGVPLNLFNVLALPLVLGVGVDYGIYIVIAMRAPGDLRRSLSTVVKPVLLSGLTTVVGFGSLATAENPALRGLGIVCATGVAWCLFSTFFFILPAYAWRQAK